MNKRFYGMAPGGRMSLDRAASKQSTYWMYHHQRTQQNSREKPTQPIKADNDCGGKETKVPTEPMCGGENGCCPINFDEIERKLKEQAEAGSHD